jgi:hypothetical protein
VQEIILHAQRRSKIHHPLFLSRLMSLVEKHMWGGLESEGHRIAVVVA